MGKKFEFADRTLAFAFADRCHKAHMVILGDNAMFWVVGMADGEKLLQAGYEVSL